MTNASLTIEIKRHKHKSVSVQELFLQGCLDEENSAVLREQIMDLIDDDKHLIILNFENLHMIDEAGSGAVISGKTKCQLNGGEMVILKPSRHVKTLMGFIRFDKVMKIFENLEEALEFLSRVP